MIEVWKFPLELKDWQAVEIPDARELLTVQMQGQSPCLWALVNTDGPKRFHQIRIAGTGHPIKEKIYAYLGTFQLSSGTLVFHVFEVAA